MEIRLARLEGAYEQIDRRLADLRQDMGCVEQRISSLELRMDQKFNWVLGLIVGTWITTILTILFHR
jgi:hypothetical protein